MIAPGAHQVLVPGYRVVCGKCGADYVVMAGPPVSGSAPPLWDLPPARCGTCNQSGYATGPRERGRPRKIA